jgi:hypothetical protein
MKKVLGLVIAFAVLAIPLGLLAFWMMVITIGYLRAS